MLRSIFDSMKRTEYTAVAGIASVARSKEHKQWKAVEAKVSCLLAPSLSLRSLFCCEGDASLCSSFSCYASCRRLQVATIVSLHKCHLQALMPSHSECFAASAG